MITAGTGSTDEVNVSLIYCYDTPGYGEGITVSGNYAYVADGGYGLQIVDISTPSNPTFVGTCDTPGWAHDITVAGNYAYVADDDKGLQVVDISTPSNPILIGTYDTLGTAYDIAVSNNYAYVTDYSKCLQVVDISTPSNPTLIGTYDTPSFTWDVALSGNYAYVTNPYIGLQIADISIPSNPTHVGTYYTTGLTYGVAVLGNYAYLTNRDGGLQIVDISTPSNPTFVGTCDTPGWAVDIAVLGNYAYIADCDKGIQVVDISTPSNPILIGTYDTLGTAYDIAVSNNYAYVADIGNGLVILQTYVNQTTDRPPLINALSNKTVNENALLEFKILATDPDNDSITYSVTNLPPGATFDPNTQIFSWLPAAGSAGTYDVTFLAVANGLQDSETKTITVIALDKNALITVINTANSKVSSAVAGVEVGQYPQTAIDAFMAAIATAQAVADSTTATQSQVNQSITDLQASEATFDAAIIKSIDKSALTTAITSANTKVAAAVAGMGIGQYPKTAIDTFKAAIAAAQIIADNTGATQAEVNQAVTALKAAESTFDLAKIITEDIKPPTSVTNLKESAVGSDWIRWTWANPTNEDFSHVLVYIDGRLVTTTSEMYYKATGFMGGTTHTIGIKTVDTSENVNSTWINNTVTTATGNEVNLKLVRYYEISNSNIEDILVSGKYAYVAQGYDFVILDITDVFNPIEIGRLPTQSSIHSITVSGKCAYLADDTNDLVVVDISSPSSPTLVGRYGTAGSAWDVVISGNYAYVADNMNDLLIVDISIPSSPTLVGKYDTSGEVWNVEVSGNYAYIAVFSPFSTMDHLEIVDVSNPSSPKLVKNYNNATDISDIFVSYKYAYITDYSAGLIILDISNPLSPILVGNYDTEMYPYGIAVSDNYAYLVGSGGLEVVDITNPFVPKLAGLSYTNGQAQVVSVSGNYAYVINYNDISIFEMNTGSGSVDNSPVANAGADKNTTTGLSVTFDASASTDDIGIASYSWDFDESNGITSEASGVTATKTYATAGTYIVTLTVTDTSGQISSDTLQVVVNPAAIPTTLSYTPLYDNRLRDLSATTVLSTTTYLDVGKTSATCRDVMLFDLSKYKTTDMISKATLSLYWYYPAGATRTSDTIVEIYRPVEWDPKYVTWNSRMSGVLWTTKGGNWFDKNGVSQGATPYASLTFAGSKVPDNKYYEFDVTSLVQDYVSGKYKNTGFFIKAKTESGNYIAFYSADASNAAVRPKLTVTSTSGSAPTDSAPVANAGADKTSTVGSAVTFDAIASTDDKGIASYSWDFDSSNGITSEASTVSATKTYTTIGTYTVTLTVTDTIGQKSTDTLQVVISAATTPVSTVSYAPTYDNRLRESSATTVLSTTSYLDIGKTTSSYRDVMLFDLSGYKTTDTVSKATLSLYWYYPAGATRASDTIVEIYRPVEWDPKYVTWNSRMSGTPWTTAGGNWFDKNAIAQGSTPYASMTFAGSSMPDNKYYEFDVTQLVQEYVSGKYKNTGFFLKAKTENGNYIAFYSADWSNTAQRPKLTVTTGSGPVDYPPVANAGNDKTTLIGTVVTFDAGSSIDDKGIASYSWDFDQSNGITADATTKIASKTYTATGIYTVTLTVTDTAGQKSTDTLQVTVNPSSVDNPPVANAGADKTATVGSDLTFDGSASTDDKGIASYSWNFGDGTTATGVSPTHKYATAGTYTVTLTVTDTAAQKATDTLQVTVNNAGSTVSYTPTYDNRLRSDTPTTVLSTTTFLDIGKSTPTSRDVMIFDLSSYKTTDTISKATLSLYWYYPAGKTRTSDTVVEVYRPVEWDPQYVTWNSRASGTLWSAAGGNWYDKNGLTQGSTPYASVTFTAGTVPGNKYYEFDVTQLVQEYVSGKYKNTGFFLKAKTENGNYIAFYSADATNAAVRPKLTITS